MSDNKHGEPLHFGRTGDDQRMLLTDGDKYFASVQIHQTPRYCGVIDEERRLSNADRIKDCINALAGIENVEAVRDVIAAARKLANARKAEHKVDQYYALIELDDAIARLDGGRG